MERFDNDDEDETAVDKNLLKKGWSENRSFVARGHAYYNKM